MREKGGGAHADDGAMVCLPVNLVLGSVWGLG